MGRRHSADEWRELATQRVVDALAMGVPQAFGQGTGINVLSGPAR
jgi:hypothetical protein